VSADTIEDSRDEDLSGSKCGLIGSTVSPPREYSRLKNASACSSARVLGGLKTTRTVAVSFFSR
jgi:hypothetical protein